MRTALIVILASVSVVYAIEALKRAQWLPSLHYRSSGRLWILNVVGALLIALCTSRDLITFWAALAIQQLVYDGIVHRSTGVHGGIR